jgi:hypothetical protein
MVQTLSLAPIQESSNGNMGLILEALMKKKAEEAKNRQDLFNLENLQKIGSYFGEDKEQTEEEKKAEEEKKKGLGSKLGGAASGAATGAKIGSIFGPIGTGVGGVIGGIGGFFS